MQILLASSSPSRKDLLNKLKLEFEIFSTDIDETQKSSESSQDLVRRLSKEKALFARSKYPNHIIIGADTVACCENVTFGKPHNFQNGLKQLLFMNNKEVNFHSGVYVQHPNGSSKSIHEVSKTIFKDNPIYMLEEYLRQEEPYNIAGSCKAEGKLICLVKEIQSKDPTSILGLPLISLSSILMDFGVKVF